MPVTGDFKSDFLDFVLCQAASVRRITHICLVDSGTGAVRDCGSAAAGAVSSGRTGGLSFARLSFTASITPTASYIANAVSVRHRVGAVDVELARTPLPASVDVTGVASVDVTWTVEVSSTPSSSGVFTDHALQRLFARVLTSLGGGTARGCLARILYYDVDEVSGVRTDLLITNLSVDRPARRAYHGVVAFTGAGSLKYYDICTDPTLSASACISDSVVSGFSPSPPGVSPSHSVSYEIVFTV